MGIIATPLGWIMKGCYFVCKNYGIALLLFTILTRLIVFPLNVKQQKSTARMTMLQPELEKIKKKYAKNQQKMQEEQMNLYAKAGVNPMASCLPMVITMVILFALIPVIYGPLTYVSNADKEELTDSNNMISNLYVVSAEVKSKDTTIEKLIEKFEKDGATEDEAYDKLEKLFTDKDKYPKSAKALSNDNKISNVMDAIKAHNDIDTFILNENYFSTNLIQSRPELMTFVFTEKEGGQYADVLPTSVKAAAEDFNYSIFGLFLGKIPTMKDLSCIIPIVSALLQLIVTFVSQHFAKKNNPDAANMGGMGMKIMLYGMPIFSLWIGFSYPAGLGLYWCYSSLFALGQTIVLNKIYTPEHVAELVQKDIAKQKKKGNYCVIEIDPAYEPAPIEHKDVFGITFEQGRNELHIGDDFFDNIVTENKELPEQAKIDLAISMITLKYTQSNSVCYVKGGQAIGIGAGQQSRIHCTRLAGQKADNWWLRQSPQVLGLQFVDGIKRADRDNAIDLYMGEDYMDVLADGAWEKIFKVKPAVFTAEEKRAWLDKNTDVALGSDAFFPFGDNIERAHKSGVKYVAEPGGSVRDDNVIETCNKYGMVMSFTGIRLFHH